jgi:hypothetical protein
MRKPTKTAYALQLREGIAELESQVEELRTEILKLVAAKRNLEEENMEVFLTSKLQTWDFCGRCGKKLF